MNSKISVKNFVLFSEKISAHKIAERSIWKLTDRLKADGYTGNQTPYLCENIFSNFCASNRIISEDPFLKWSK